VRNRCSSPRCRRARPATCTFVELLVKQDNQIVDRNVYWESTSKQDTVDWSATLGNPQATMTQYADLTGLKSVGPGQGLGDGQHNGDGRADGADRVTKVTVTNTSTTPTVASSCGRTCGAAPWAARSSPVTTR